MAASLVYKNALLYEAVMMVLYGRNYFARYKAVADLIPEGSSVVDVCCGPAVLYDRYLRHKQVRYTGLDVSAEFINRLRQRGGAGEVVDLNVVDRLPEADYVVMQASLCHFLPNPHAIIERMLRAAQARAIVAEPIRNMASSQWALAAAIARRFTDPGDGHSAHRFTEQTLDEFFASFADRVVTTCYVPGRREKIVILNGGTMNAGRNEDAVAESKWDRTAAEG